MKKITLLTIMSTFLVGATTSLRAQSAEATKNAEAFNIKKSKLLAKMERFAPAQLTVSYKLTSSETTVSKERSTGKMAGAKLTAYLETTDGQLTDDDFQEVTDYFYSYFQKTLKKNGIDTVAWSKIAATDFYKGADEKKVSNEQEKSGGQVWATFNANKGNILYGGFAGFAFGKIKKAQHFCEDIDAAAGFFYITVDFADIAVNLDIKTHEGYYEIKTNYKYTAATKPMMKVIPSDELSLLWNEKAQSDGLMLQKPLVSNMVYHTAVNQDPSRLHRGAFDFAKKMNPVVIETTRDKYKAAAKKALENYADAFVAKAKEIRD